jgi:LuxR family maltose regulon positive regulatory protein
MRLCDVLSRRFDVPVVTLVAGAGFGKTTAIAQAMRVNDGAPRGIDAWLACEAGDEDASRLSAAVIRAIGVRAGRGDPLDRLVAALGEHAPHAVCVVLDDVHELPAHSAGLALVRQLVAVLPAHAHLVLTSRKPIPIPLARRRAAGQVVELTDAELAFTDHEVAALAAQLGLDPEAGAGMAGWPSLVRLALCAPPRATRQFLWEEIIRRLPRRQRTGLLALAMLGSGSRDELEMIARSGVDVDALLAHVPLLYEDAEGRIGAHGLWTDAAERIVAPGELRALQERTMEVLLRNGETVRLGSAAAHWQDADMFRVACVALVRESFGALPVETGQRWLAAAPLSAVGTPEYRLLELALRQSRRPQDPMLDDELDALEVRVEDRVDVDARAVTLGLAAIVAHARGDLVRLLRLAERVSALPTVDQLPILRFFVSAMDAAAASLRGDPLRALAVLDAMPLDEVPGAVQEIVIRLRVAMLGLAGRADEAVALSGDLAESPHPYVRTMPDTLRWTAGDPNGYLSARPSIAALEHLTERDRFMHTTHCMAVAGSLGDVRLANTMDRELRRCPGNPADPRDSAIAAGARAVSAIIGHDDGLARSLVADHLDRWPLSNRLGEMHLRRFLAVAYVCDERARRHWDGATFGHTLLRARDIGHMLHTARTGGSDPLARLPPAEVLLTTLPLAWTIELLTRAAGAGNPDGLRAVRVLASWIGVETRRELAWLRDDGDPTCRTPAAELLDAIGATDPTRLAIDVLGPMRVRHADTDLTGPGLRRQRVRTLLAVLVLRGRIRRAELVELLWPDLAPDNGPQNLRVTLSRLRTCLGSAVHESPDIWIRTDGQVLELVGLPLVETDYGMLVTCLADADKARRNGHLTETIGCLARAVALWRGDAFADLDAIEQLAPEVQRVQNSLLDACLLLGELRLAAGQLDDAMGCAERARDASPYSERAHRLAIACALHRSDRSGLLTAVQALETMVRELDIAPEATTSMLLRRALARLGHRELPRPVATRNLAHRR